MSVKTVRIEGCHPTHWFAEILDGVFGDREPRVCVRCLVREDRPEAEIRCDKATAIEATG